MECSVDRMDMGYLSALPSVAPVVALIGRIAVARIAVAERAAEVVT